MVSSGLDSLSTHFLKDFVLLFCGIINWMCHEIFWPQGLIICRVFSKGNFLQGSKVSSDKNMNICQESTFKAFSIKKKHKHILSYNTCLFLQITSWYQ